MHPESFVVAEQGSNPQAIAENPRQLAIDFSRALGEAGMARTLEAESDEWIAKALRAIRRFGELPGWHQFKTEDFRAWYGSPPHDHHVWGALTNRACKEGVIRWTGRYAPSASPKTHGHPVKVWEVVS